MSRRIKAERCAWCSAGFVREGHAERCARFRRWARIFRIGAWAGLELGWLALVLGFTAWLTSHR